MGWIRCRFVSTAEDYVPIKFPPPGPYWCSGVVDEDAYRCFHVVAYVKRLSDLCKYWPEAEDIEFTKEKEIKFSDRFPKPEWWTGC
jgi:hypothetical protein